MTQKEELNLTASPRQTGKHFSRAHRVKMEIPAVVYGPKIKNLNLNLRENELVKYLKSKYENSIFTLKSDNKDLNGIKVLKKAVAIHPVTRRPVHIDLFAIDMTQTIRVWIEVKFTGKAEGLKEGGVLNVATREIEIECLPNAIPEEISIDVTHLNVGESLHVTDLKLPDGVELMSSDKDTLCTVAIVEEVTETPAAEASGEAADAAAKPDAAAKAPAADAAKKDDKK